MTLINTKNKLLTMGIFTLFLLLILLAPVAYAQNQPTTPPPANGSVTNDASKFLDFIAQQSKLSTAGQQAPDTFVIIAKIIQIALSLIGVIFLGLIVYAGYEWLTAGGNEEKVAKARHILYQSTIGLGIIVIAYLVTNLIINQVLTAIAK